MDVEFYPVRDLAADAAAGHSLVQRIAAKVQPEIWGEDPAKGAIQFDIPGRTLIVRAPQPVQARSKNFLARSASGNNNCLAAIAQRINCSFRSCVPSAAWENLVMRNTVAIFGFWFYFSPPGSGAGGGL